MLLRICLQDWVSDESLHVVFPITIPNTDASGFTHLTQPRRLRSRTKNVVKEQELHSGPDRNKAACLRATLQFRVLPYPHLEGQTRTEELGAQGAAAPGSRPDWD